MVKNPSGTAKGRQHAAMLSVDDILVFANHSPAAINAIAYAEALAPEGNVAALLFGLMPNYPISDFDADSWIIARQNAEAAAAASEAAMQDMLNGRGLRAELRRADIMAGEEGRVIAMQSRYVDAVVFGWATNEATRPVHEFEAVLFDSGRPALVVPEGCTLRGLPSSVMVAWSSTRETSRAVHDALPLLAAADQVSVVVVEDGASSEQNPGDDMARHLARHDVAVEVRHVPAGGRVTAAVLKDEARFQGAELIVMGGYSHSRAGEWLFGGVTRDMLGTPNVPLFLSH